MIAERPSKTLEVQSNIAAEGYQAGIDDENMAWVISLFTDLYSDPQRAVIREYSTNAHDAQIEAGVKGPIEITLPSPLAPFFKVKDRGVGLDPEDIRKVYSRYGTSTKRGTNDQNGMLGMGCKSALAYTSQFTVESVKNGLRTVVSISREDDGVPVFTPVASVPDSGPNGTEVIVPVQRQHHDDFARKAAEFYSVWPKDSVLINGEPPVPLDGLRLSDDLLLTRNQYGYSRKPHQVVMGNVAYPLDNEKFSLDIPATYRLVARVPMGAVEFAPSRELLLYNKTTRDTLAALPARVTEAINKAVQEKIDGARTAREALKLAMEHGELLGKRTVEGLKFKGREMPTKIDGYFTLVPWRSHKVSESTNAPNGLDVSYMANALVVVGYELSSFTATHKRKLMQYVENAGIDQPQFFALCASQPKMDWLENSQIIAWADVAAIKLPRDPSAAVWRNGRPTGAFDVFIGGGRSQHIQADQIDQNENVYYARARNANATNSYAQIIGKYDPAATVVCVPENRYAKFKRNFPEAAPFNEGVQAAYKMWLANLSKGVRLALTINDKADLGTFKMIDPAKVDDPEVKRACHIARKVDIKDVLNERRSFNSVMHAIDFEETGIKWTDPLKAYPLVEYLTSVYKNGRHTYAETTDHFYLYLNTAYAAAQAESA